MRRILDIFASEIERHAGAIQAIYDGDLGGILVREAMAPGRAEAVAEAVERERDHLHWTPQSHRDLRPDQMLVMGMTLTPVSGFDLDLERYFEVAERFGRDCARVFGDPMGIEPLARRWLGAMAGGRRIEVPVDRSGRRYTPATLRSLPHGCGIPVHCGNFFLSTPGYRRLSPQLDTSVQLSYFFTLRAAEAGGELEIHDLAWGDPSTPMRADGLYDGERIAREHPGPRLRPGAGDLLVFDGGRYYHRVTPVEGRTRLTIGGFAGLSPEHDRVLFWS